ncbi:MAG: type VI secretion system tube protein Hcp [Planctomycetes bacterium]|nr:type VI secretion system tube protein Hcp [Planctomycetota bacterium]
MAFDAYLKIEGVEGESSDKNHAKWIEVLSVSHGISQSATATSAGGSTSGGRADHSDITVVKQIDSSSPVLLLACCNAKAHKNATIEFCRAMEDKQVFLKWELADVVVTGVRPYAAGGSEYPQEEVSLNYSTIKWTYTKTDVTGKATGDVVAGWNLKENVKM